VIYEFLDSFLFLFHLAVVLFNVFGGLAPRLRPLHRVSLVLVLFSWFVLGAFYGWGYCFLTDWHFMIREKLGKRDPYNNYLQLLFSKFGIELTPFEAERIAVIGLLFGIGTEILPFMKGKKKEKA